MHLHRIRIQNFRNFRETGCRLARHVVILGENAAGKSNLFHALRLLLDPALPDAERFLDEEDFWDGGVAFAGTEIVVSVDLTEYAEEPAVLACLADYEIEVPSGSSAVARLTYRFAPRDTIDATNRSTTTKEDYDFAIYGGEDPSNTVAHDVRRFLGFKVLHALRDAEGDLRAWKRSPLRPCTRPVDHVVAARSPLWLAAPARGGGRRRGSQRVSGHGSTKLRSRAPRGRAPLRTSRWHERGGVPEAGRDLASARW